MLIHGVARRAATHEHTSEVDRQPGGGRFPHARSDDLGLGRQYELEGVLRLACGIVEQYVLCPRADVDGEDGRGDGVMGVMG